jgi:hypothetical protein
VQSNLTHKDECFFVCLYLIQIHISEPIGTKLCTHLPRGLEDTVRYVWAHFFLPILSRAGADSCTVVDWRRHAAPLLRYIRGVTSRTIRCAMKTRRSGQNVCVCENGNLMRRDVTNELNLQLHCSYTNDNVQPI